MEMIELITSLFIFSAIVMAVFMRRDRIRIKDLNAEILKLKRENSKLKEPPSVCPPIMIGGKRYIADRITATCSMSKSMMVYAPETYDEMLKRDSSLAIAEELLKCGLIVPDLRFSSVKFEHENPNIITSRFELIVLRPSVNI